MRKETGKTIFGLSLVFCLTVALLLGLLLLSTQIPKTAIAPQMRTSAEYLCEHPLFGEAAEGVGSTKIDHYADAILLGIVWQMDGSAAFRSAMEASYYHSPYQNENENLRDAVEKDLPANQQYLRYWHGSAAFVRVLMSFLTLPQIYLWHRILLGGLLLALLLRLLLRRDWVLAIGIAVGCVGSSLWLVPRSLEYTWVYLILLVQLHIVISPRFPRDWKKRLVFFLVSGMVTNYLDFLTCETLTLLVPLLVLLWRDHAWPARETESGRQKSPMPAHRPSNKEEKNAPWKALLGTAAVWLLGYAGMFLVKWLLAGIALGTSPLPYVLEHIEERTIGAGQVGFLAEFLLAIPRNFRSLFPLDYGIMGLILGLAAIVLLFYLGYVYHSKGFDGGLATRLLVVGLIPYLRYLGLANHSYIHYFFTYRAQMATLLAAVLLVGELTGWSVGKGDSI